MTEDQIKYMADRFLGWHIPESFSPDAGISFTRLSYQRSADTMPSGTNLFDATQALEMVRFMVDGLPKIDVVAAAQNEADKFFAKEATFDKANFVDGARFAAALAAPHEQGEG